MTPPIDTPDDLPPDDVTPAGDDGPPEDPPESPPGESDGSAPPGGDISPINIEDEMKSSYLDYAMSVIVGRALPDVRDGLKPSQRKVLFSCFKRKLRSDIKVAQLSGYVSEHSAYHHGEASLAMTIVNLAQDFVGSNNVNLLVPSGQFGTRLQGGKDHASPRYIFTLLSQLTLLLFPLLLLLLDRLVLLDAFK